MLVEHGVPSYQKRGNSNLIIIHRRAIIHSEVFDATDRGTNTGGRTPRNGNTTPVAGHARPAHTESTSAATTQAAAASLRTSHGQTHTQSPNVSCRNGLTYGRFYLRKHLVTRHKMPENAAESVRAGACPPLVLRFRLGGCVCLLCVCFARCGQNLKNFAVFLLELYPLAGRSLLPRSRRTRKYTHVSHAQAIEQVCSASCRSR